VTAMSPFFPDCDFAWEYYESFRVKVLWISIVRFSARDAIGIFLPQIPPCCPLHYVQFVKYDVTVSFMAQVLDTVTYLVPQVLDTAS